MKHKKQIINWVDSTTKFGWVYLDDIIKDAKGYKSFLGIETLAFVVYEDDNVVMVTPAINNHGSIDSPMVIPKVAILKRRNIK